MKHDQKMIRKHHSLLLFKIIKEFGTISRADLAKKTKMSATSVSRIIKDLIDEGFVDEVGQTEGSVGRKATLLEVNPQGALMVGVNLDVESLQVGIVDLFGKVLRKKTSQVDLSQKPEHVLDQVVEMIHQIIDEMKDLQERMIGVGVSIPGIVEWPNGNIVHIPQFGWNNVQARKFLEKHIDKPVFVDNQVKTTLLGESFYGCTVGIESSVCIYVGSGVGGAVMNNGELLRGFKNAAGEIGHTTIDPNGSLCDCGRFGCLQTFICSSALEKEAGVPMNEIFYAVKQNKQWAVRLIEKATEYLAIAISNASCLYNPQVIVLAGTMIDQWPEWAEKVVGKYKSYLWNPLENSFEIRYPNSGPESGIIGASTLVLSEFLQSPITISPTSMTAQ